MLALAEAQEHTVRHGEGPLLLLGAAGTGKTEALARRLVTLADEGLGPERILLFAANRPTARRLRQRVETLLDRSSDELWVGTWQELGERLLRELSTSAGLDPFFDILGRGERLAMLLDRIDDLPLRNREIRGNPAGLLARLLVQTDELKAGSEPPEPDLAEFCAAHDRILAESGNLDEGDVFLILNKLLHERDDVRAEIAARFAHLMVDELEDTTHAQRAILAALATDNPNHVYALETKGEPTQDGWFHKLHPQGEVVELEQQHRKPTVKFWRCVNERAQAQAVAREAERLLAGGTSPEAICVLVDDPVASGGTVAAAMEERGIPFHLSGLAQGPGRPGRLRRRRACTDQAAG
jgi:DNA helicase-2/ATP-dependent DNA helicase PcrA